MDKKTVKLSTEDLKDTFACVDNSNYKDFSSLKPIIKKMYKDVTGEIFYEIVSYLQMELGVNSDAELVDISDYEMDELVEYFNENFESDEE